MGVVVGSVDGPVPAGRGRARGWERPADGRSNQLAMIRRVLAEPEDRSRAADLPAAILLEGDPGIGRSTALAALGRHAAAAGFTVAEFCCDPRERGPDGRAAAALITALAGAGAPRRGPGETEPRGFDRAVDAACARTAVLLIIDDVQCCDEPSLHWLARLARRIGQIGPGRLVLLAAVRDGEPPSNPEEFADFAGHCRRIRLAGLGFSEVCETAAAALGGDCDPVFGHALLDLTHGNPRLVHALLGELAARGLNADAATAAKLAAHAPRSVADDVQARLCGLGPDAVALAEAVAVLGRHAELPAAARLAGLPGARAAAAADRLSDRRILRNRQPLSFRHGLVAAAVVRFLTAGRSNELHLRAASYLHKEGADADETAGHLVRTCPFGEPWVVDSLTEAARTALAEGRREAAIGYLRRALREPAEPDRRALILADLGRAEGPIEVGSALEHLDAALRAVIDPAVRAETAAGLAAALIARGRSAEARAVLDLTARCLAAVDDALAVRLEAWAMASLVLELSESRELRERGQRLVGRASQDAVAQAAFDVARAWDECRQGESSRGAAALAASVLVRGFPENPCDQLIYGIGVLTLIHAENDDLARHYCDLALAAAERRDDRIGRAMAWRLRACLAYWAGQLESAVEFFRRGRALFREAGGIETESLGDSFFLHALIDSGEYDEASRLLGVDRVHLAEPVGDVLLGGVYGHLLFALGDDAGAVAALLAHGRLIESHGWTGAAFGDWRFRAVQALTAGAGEPRDGATSGDPGRARACEQACSIAKRAVEIARQWGRPRAIGTALHAQALAFSAVGDPAALAAFEEAADVLASAGSPLLPARLLTDHAAALVAPGPVFGREHRFDAVAKLRRAEALARSCGAVPLAERAAQLLERRVDVASESLSSASASGFLEIRCFGGFRLLRDGEVVDCAAIRPRVRSLLHLLAVHAGRPVHRELLLDALWPGLDFPSGIRNLQVAVSQLRAFLDAEPFRTSRHQRLQRDGESYRLALLPGDQCDVREFEAAVLAWRAVRVTGTASAIVEPLRAAHAFYVGDLLPEAGPSEWVSGERLRLRVLASDVLGALAEAELAGGHPDAAREAARASLDLDEYRDSSWRVLIAAYRALGSHAAADRVRRDYEEILRDLARPL